MRFSVTTTVFSGMILSSAVASPIVNTRPIYGRPTTTVTSATVPATSASSAVSSASAPESSASTPVTRVSVSATSTSAPASTATVPAGQAILKCTVPGTVALTFDDGPWEYTEKAMDLLKSGG